VKTHITKS